MTTTPHAQRRALTATEIVMRPAPSTERLR